MVCLVWYTFSGVNSMENKLWSILNSDQYYSISSKYLMKEFNIDRDKLTQLVKSLEKNKKVQVNTFEYNSIEYIGLESRRIDYEKDKVNGTNRIEKLIEKGYYGKTQKRINTSSILLSLMFASSILFYLIKN